MLLTGGSGLFMRLKIVLIRLRMAASVSSAINLELCGIALNGSIEQEKTEDEQFGLRSV